MIFPYLINNYPYTSMNYQNIDWLITTITKLSKDFSDLETKTEASINGFADELKRLAAADESLGDRLDSLNKMIDDLAARSTSLEENLQALREWVDSTYVVRTSEPFRIYGTDDYGQASTFRQSVNIERYSIPLRDDKGEIKTAYPTSVESAASKGYVDQEAADTLTDAKSYADAAIRDRSGSWRKTYELVCTKDTSIPASIEFGTSGDVAGVRLAVWSDGLSSTSQIETNKTQTSKITAGLASDASVQLPVRTEHTVTETGTDVQDAFQVMEKSAYTADGKSFYYDESAFSNWLGFDPAEVTKSFKMGPSSLAADSYVTNRSLDLYTERITPKVSLYQRVSPNDVTMPPDSEESWYLFNRDDSSTSRAPYRTTLDTTIFEKQMEGLEVMSSSGPEAAITSKTKVVVEENVLWYYNVVVSAGDANYTYRFYYDGKFDEYGLIGSKTYQPQIYFILPEIATYEYQKTVTGLTGFYNSTKPDEIIYFAANGAKYDLTNYNTFRDFPYHQAQLVAAAKEIALLEWTLIDDNALMTKSLITTQPISSFDTFTTMRDQSSSALVSTHSNKIYFRNYQGTNGYTKLLEGSKLVIYVLPKTT